MIPEQFAAITGYTFRQQDLLEQALTHRSFSRTANNERLEFFGDSILNLVISKYIYRQFPDADEGELSRIRASLVKQETLALVAMDMGLGAHIHLGGGELKSGGYRRASILADVLEAVIAAIYLDSDYQQTETVILKLFQNYLQNLPDAAELIDPKTRLQEILQARKLELPEYEVEQTRGKSHNQVFTVSCNIAMLDLKTSGSGSSRKKAEQQAATKMLTRIPS